MVVLINPQIKSKVHLHSEYISSLRFDFYTNKYIFYKPFSTFSMGYNGRDCILRTLCESRQYFQRTKMNMVGEMLRTIFRWVNYLLNIYI